MQTFYQLLSVEASATAEEIKKAFRAEIARYHPDKVQHLGQEFQAMAATRAAQLTEAYRTLMNPELRSEYDRLYVAGAATAAPPSPGATAPPPGAATPRAPATSHEQPATPPQATGEPGAVNRPPRFAKEHATRDEFVRKATLARLRQVLAAEHGTISELTTKGLDFDCATKSKKLFGRGEGQRFAVRFVPVVNRATVLEAWAHAQKAGGPICVFLMGNGMASAKELADAFTEARKKSRGDKGVNIIPIDVRDWTAHVPADAPEGCKSIIQKLREVAS